MTKHLEQLGHEVTLVNHVDTQSAKAWASKQKIRTYEASDVQGHVCADVVDKMQTTLVYDNTK